MSPIIEELRDRGLVLASNNKGKLKELQRILEPLEIQLHSPTDLIGDLEVEETEHTFEGNAALKAVAFARACGLPALADDSGLCVHALSGGPGVYSARYGGAGLDDAGRRDHLLNEMQSVHAANRQARFVCVLALSMDGRAENIQYFRAEAPGLILNASRGEGGFGYDPIFLDEETNMSFAELSPEQKDEKSHRGRALASFVEALKQAV